MLKELNGVYVALFTPLLPNGDIDLGGLGNLVDYVVSQGVHGLVVLGTTGEFCEFSSEERQNIIRRVVEASDSRVPVIVGISDLSLEQTCRNCVDAVNLGADGVLVLPPLYWKLGSEGLFKYFMKVANISSLPVILYNFPALVSTSISAELVARLAESSPRFIGVKMTVRNGADIREMARVTQAVRKDFAVVTGYEDLLLDTIWAGGTGTISGLANIWPKDIVSFYELAKSEEINLIDAVKSIMKLCEIYNLTTPMIGGLKAVANLMGAPMGAASRVIASNSPDEIYELASKWTENYKVRLHGL